MDATADDELRELRELRARAYGPHADIASDPAAMRRLQELESSRVTAPDRRERARPASEPSLASSADGDAARPDRGEGRDEDSLSGDEGVPPPPPPPASGWSAWAARRQALLWATSVVVTAAVAAVITYTLVSMPTFPASADASQIATLELTRTPAIPSGWFGAEKDTAAAEFAGMTVFTTAGWYSDSGQRSSEDRCLNVVRSDQVPEDADFTETSWSFDGQMYSACGVGAFRASVALPFDGGISDELAERYPDGAALQFILDGDLVAVVLDNSSD